MKLTEDNLDNYVKDRLGINWEVSDYVGSDEEPVIVDLESKIETRETVFGVRRFQGNLLVGSVYWCYVFPKLVKIYDVKCDGKDCKLFVFEMPEDLKKDKWRIEYGNEPNYIISICDLEDGFISHDHNLGVVDSFESIEENCLTGWT